MLAVGRLNSAQWGSKFTRRQFTPQPPKKVPHWQAVLFWTYIHFYGLACNINQCNCIYYIKVFHSNVTQTHFLFDFSSQLPIFFAEDGIQTNIFWYIGRLICLCFVWKCKLQQWQNLDPVEVPETSSWKIIHGERYTNFRQMKNLLRVFQLSIQFKVTIIYSVFITLENFSYRSHFTDL